jgi:hypothetical protein
LKPTNFMETQYNFRALNAVCNAFCHMWYNPSLHIAVIRVLS